MESLSCLVLNNIYVTGRNVRENIEEETFHIPTKYIDVSTTTHTSLDVMMEKNINLERGWRKRIIRCMDRLHKIHFIERKAT